MSHSLNRLARKTLGAPLILVVTVVACLHLHLFLLYTLVLGLLVLLEFRQQNKGEKALLPLLALFCLDLLAVFLTPWCCLVVILQVMFVDVCANLWGSFWTKSLGHSSLPFASEISPKKTWAGAWAGLLGGTLGFPLLLFIAQSVWQPSIIANNATVIFFQSQPLLNPLAYVWGLICAWLAQLGDLYFSSLKRSFGIKDFYFIYRGKQIFFFGAHGGVGDRIDSWTFVSYFSLGWLALTQIFPSLSTTLILFPLLIFGHIRYFALKHR